MGRTSRAAQEVVVPAVRAAVAAVVEPVVGEPLGELGLVGAVDADRSGRPRVQVRSVSSRPGDMERLREAVTRAVAAVPAAAPAGIEVDVLDTPGRAALGGRLRALHRPPGELGSATRIYAVGSGKGGVGKSTVTANLAAVLAEQGQRVGVLDADVWGYSVPQLFGVDESPLAVSGMMLPVTAHGVRMMSMGFFVAEDEPVVWRGPMLQKALEQFLTDVFWGPLDVLLVDLPPGTGDVPLSVMQLLPGAALLVVTTPQQAAVKVAARTGRMALDNRMPLAGVVENMTGGAFGSGGGRDLAGLLGTAHLGSVPLDESLRAGGDVGLPAVLDSPGSPAASVLHRIATRLPEVRASLVGRQLPLFVGGDGPGCG